MGGGAGGQSTVEEGVRAPWTRGQSTVGQGGVPEGRVWGEGGGGE